MSARAQELQFRSLMTVGFCVLAALAEGIDLQAGGIAAPGVAAAFGFAREQVGNFVSFSNLGLLFGAAIGGGLADRFGRKTVLLWSVALFGVFSIGTAQAWDYPSILIMRLLTGLGLGGTLANLVALSSEAAGPRFQGMAVGLTYMGLPLGSTITALVASTLAQDQWRVVFYLGGVAPLIIVPALAYFLPESVAYEQARETRPAREPVWRALFGEGHTPATLLLWVGFFFVQLAIYLVLNWMPTLLRDQGFDQAQASTIQSFFSFGSIAGILVFGRALDRIDRRVVAVIAFICAVAAQYSLTATDGFAAVGAAVFASGAFLAAAMLALLAAAPLAYGVRARGTGVGAAVAAGRLGGYAGPTTAGYLMAAGMLGPTVLLMSVPGLIVAGLATFVVLLFPQNRG